MKTGVVLIPSILVTLLMASQGYAKPLKLLPDDGRADDQFGYSVAIDGTTLLAGAHKSDPAGMADAGAAYVYTLGPSGWHQQAKLTADPAHAHDTLGGNLALKGRMAAIGAIKRDDKGEDAGAVFIFAQKADEWMQTQVITAPDGKAGDAFGQSIAMSDRYLVIGAPRADAPQRDMGAVYIYRRDNNTWRFQTRLAAHDAAPGDLFGISVALDDNTVLVGADLNDEKAEKAGAVYAFVTDGKRWSQEAKLMADDGADTDIFGVRVALDGDTALISARRDDLAGVGVDAGSAYIFERNNGRWRQTQKLLAPDGRADDRFARGVALHKDTALITAMHHGAAGEKAGALYVFRKQHGQWQFASKVVARDAAPEDRFGWNVAMTDNHAVVATPHRDDNGNGSGAVYVMELED